MIQYKFVELAVVTEDTLEQAVNEWVGRGWQLDGIRFVVTEHSRRPAMAFVSFVREADEAEATAPSPPAPRPAARPASTTPPAFDVDPLPRRRPPAPPPIELGELELPEGDPLIERDPE